MLRADSCSWQPLERRHSFLYSQVKVTTGCARLRCIPLPLRFRSDGGALRSGFLIRANPPLGIGPVARRHPLRRRTIPLQGIRTPHRCRRRRLRAALPGT